MKNITKVSFDIRTVDMQKIEETFLKREQLIFELDELKCKHMQQEQKLRNKVHKINQKITELRKGKKVKKK